ESVAGKIVALENMIDKIAMRERLSVVLIELGAL
ncbi:PTS ascorbate transporter subunit IIB, partial [Escherichia coli]|nr:PTS ascorbate transporter subunit IIB [Escherichia coli]